MTHEPWTMDHRNRMVHLFDEKITQSSGSLPNRLKPQYNVSLEDSNVKICDFHVSEISVSNENKKEKIFKKTNEKKNIHKDQFNVSLSNSDSSSFVVTDESFTLDTKKNVPKDAAFWNQVLESLRLFVKQYNKHSHNVNCSICSKEMNSNIVKNPESFPFQAFSKTLNQQTDNEKIMAMQNHVQKQLQIVVNDCINDIMEFDPWIVLKEDEIDSSQHGNCVLQVLTKDAVDVDESLIKWPLAMFLQYKFSQSTEPAKTWISQYFWSMPNFFFEETLPQDKNFLNKKTHSQKCWLTALERYHNVHVDKYDWLETMNRDFDNPKMFWKMASLMEKGHLTTNLWNVFYNDTEKNNLYLVNQSAQIVRKAFIAPIKDTMICQWLLDHGFVNVSTLTILQVQDIAFCQDLFFDQLILLFETLPDKLQQKWICYLIVHAPPEFNVSKFHWRMDDLILCGRYDLIV